MSIEEKNQTRKRIIDALFDLLAYKNYCDITISRIVDKAGLGRRTFYRYFKTKDEVIEYSTKLLLSDFADTIMLNHAETQRDIITSYFEFWENHITMLQLLRKAHLLYFIEDNLVSLIYDVAVKTGHISHKLSYENVMGTYEELKYAFAIKLGGIWKSTVMWSLEEPRRSPEEMSIIINDVLK